MIRSLLCILFLLNIKLSQSNNVAHYLRRKYAGSSLRLYRRLEFTTKKLRKAQLDHEFLLYCKMSYVTPNFVKFKLYRSNLYDSEFYRNATETLLNMEINVKSKAINRLQPQVTSLSIDFFASLSFLDKIYIRSLLEKNISKYVADIKATHERKLLKLGVRKSKFITPEDVIFNYSSYKLSKKEKFLLSLGLDFCLPNFSPKFPQFFLPFEMFFDNLKKLPSHINLEKARQSIQNIAQDAFNSLKTPHWFPFLKKDDFQTLKSLSKREDLVFCRPDKGKGVVILNKCDYNNKVNEILSDNTKFCKVGPPDFNLIIF